MSYNFDKDQNHYLFKNNKSIPLVFIHGVGLNQGMWQPQINYFKDETVPVSYTHLTLPTILLV